MTPNVKIPSPIAAFSHESSHVSSCHYSAQILDHIQNNRMVSPLYASAYDLLGYFSSQRSCRKFHSATLYPPLVFGSKAQMTRQDHTPQDGISPYESKARS
jgi:hypothetical protein